MAPPRPRNPGGRGGDSDGPTPPRPRGGAGGTGGQSVSAAQDAVAQVAARGRPGSGGGRGPESGTGGRVPGPAGSLDLRPPSSRHDLNSIGPRSPAKAENTVVMPGVDTGADLRAIESGQARWNPDTQRYELPNGRIYGVKDNGTLFPVSGPGFEQLSRGEYQALQQYIRTGGDIEAADRAMARNPFITEADRQRALEIFRHHNKFQG